MIWQIYYDGNLIYDPRLTDDQDYQLSIRNASLTLGLNSAGSLVFTMDSTNPFQSSLQLMRGKVKVVQSGSTDTTFFIGRIVNLEKNFDLSVTVTCEGALARTNDSYIAPYIFPDSFSPSGNPVEWWLNWIITSHNSQQAWSTEGVSITLGTVTVTAPDDYIYRKREEPTNIWAALKEDFIESDLGGYFRVRYSGDTVYLDYLAAASGTNAQPVEYALNLLDITDGYSGADMFNAVYPTGKDSDGNVVTIASVTDGYYDEDGNYSATYQTGYRYYKQANYILDYENRNTYGLIFRAISYDGVTTAADVLSAAIESLNSHVDVVPRTMTVSAVDLANVSSVDGLDVLYNSMSIGSYVNVYSPAHSINVALILTELAIDICDPTSSTITLGNTSSTISSSVASASADEAQAGAVRLWTNPNPTSTFAAQTVTVSGLSSYKRFQVVYRWATNNASSQESCEFVRTDEATFRGCCDITDVFNDGMRSRRFSIASAAPNNMVWETGYAWVLSNGSSSSGDGVIIPLYVYGLN